MRKAIKPLAIVVATVILLTSMTIGVLAIATSNISFLGNIDFISSNADVFLHSVKYYREGAEDNVQTIDEYAGLYIDNELNMSLPDYAIYTGVIFEFELTNVSASNWQVGVGYTKPSTDFTVSSPGLIMPADPTASPISGERHVLKVEVNYFGGGTGYTNSVALTLSFNAIGGLLKLDVSEKYWYVEMGTISTATEIEYIRWRYISADDTTPYTHDGLAPCGSPGTMGYFILETDTTAVKRDYDGVGDKLLCI